MKEFQRLTSLNISFDMNEHGGIWRLFPPTILPLCWSVASWELPLGRCVSLQSHKARPTVRHLGCERALHFSFWVLLLLWSVCPSVRLYGGIGQSLALCPAWHGEQSCCFLSGDKQHSPILLLSFPLLISSSLVISNQHSHRARSFSTLSQRPWRTTPGQNDLFPPLKGFPCHSFTSYHMLPWIICLVPFV